MHPSNVVLAIITSFDVIRENSNVHFTANNNYSPKIGCQKKTKRSMLFFFLYSEKPNILTYVRR